MATASGAVTSVGSVVPYSKTYTSNISQADAQALADNDANFAAEGQANANALGSCTYTYTVVRTENFTKNNC